MPDTLIELKNIFKNFKYFVLSDISLKLNRGEILAVFGPNGSGKSSLIDIIAGVENYDEGHLTIFGKTLKELSQIERQKIGVIRNEIVFPENLSLNIFLKSVALLYDNWDYDRLNYFLKKYNLDKRKKIKELSGGMKLKLWITITFAHSSEILLLDEPLTGLDINCKNEFMEVISQMKKKDKTSMIFVTNELDNIESVCDKILILINGKKYFLGESNEFISKWTKIVFYGTPPDIYKYPLLKEIKNNDQTIWFLSEKVEIIKSTPNYFLNNNSTVSKATLKEILPIIFAQRMNNE